MSNNKEVFNILKRVRSVTHAWRGIRIFMASTKNAWIHAFAAVVTIMFGFYFKISATEWIFVVLSIGLVFITEAVNTAIEVDINLTSPEYHPYARDTKDIAAGAVLMSYFTTLVVGLIIFLPKFI